MVEDDNVPQVHASSELQFGALREVVAREGQKARRGEHGSALSGGYTPVTARLEGSSIIDEPVEC